MKAAKSIPTRKQFTIVARLIRGLYKGAAASDFGYSMVCRAPTSVRISLWCMHQVCVAMGTDPDRTTVAEVYATIRKALRDVLPSK